MLFTENLYDKPYGSVTMTGLLRNKCHFGIKSTCVTLQVRQLR